jgi:CubicO group peptidase (beta-lactamase class C family)
MKAFVRSAGATALILASACNGCTSYRILRYRQPDARKMGMFASRPVRKADQPFVFARATEMRTDLDTVSVRGADGRRLAFRQYMEAYNVLAFLVVRNDTIVYETYRDGLTDSTPHNSFSVAKSFLSALVGIAIGEGKIRSLDDPITDYVRELRGRPAFEGVTVRHLLAMKSGLRFTETGRGALADFRSDDAHVYYTTHLLETLAGSKRATVPGAEWDYKDSDAELLGFVLARAVGTNVAAYTEEKLWRRIGSEHDATWHLDRKNGQEKVSTGFNATARDYARFGRLYLNGGRWGADQVVPAAWVAQSVSVDSSRPEPEISTWWKMQHTLYWWHAIQPLAGDFFADGSHGQRIYVDRRTRTVIVQLANDSRQDFPFRKVVAHLNGERWEYPRSIPALLRQAAVSFGADSVRPVVARLTADQRLTPERYVITRHAMIGVGQSLAADPRTRASGIEVLRVVTEIYPTASEGFVALGDAYRAASDRARAADALRRAAELAPTNPDIARRIRALQRP